MHEAFANVLPDRLARSLPPELSQYRDEPHTWESFGVSLREFGEEDQQRIRSLYDSARNIATACFHDSSTEGRGDARNAILQAVESEIFEQLDALGCDSDSDPGLFLRNTIHDIRGGPLSVLASLAPLVPMMEEGDEPITQCCSAARDAGKMLRLLVFDLDAHERRKDELGKAHNIDHFIEKWSNMLLTVGERCITVNLHCEFEGNISARCLETSAIDRVSYNMANNAARFSTERSIDMYIYSPFSQYTRWLFANKVDDAQRDFLLEQTGGDLSSLFEGGITRGGHGIGLRNTADMIAECFGLSGHREAIESGYVGGMLLDHRVYFWFHWPCE